MITESEQYFSKALSRNSLQRYGNVTLQLIDLIELDQVNLGRFIRTFEVHNDRSS